MSDRKEIKELCRSLGKYDTGTIQGKFPNMSRHRIAKLIAPYSEVDGIIYVDESNVTLNRWFRYTIYRYIGTAKERTEEDGKTRP